MSNYFLIGLGIVVAIVIAYFFMIYNNNNNIYNKKQLGNYLGIDFNENVLIKDFKWKYTESESTEIYLRVMTQNSYAAKTEYFKDGKSTLKDYYSNIEKKFQDDGYYIQEILYDNIIYKEYVEKKPFSTTYKPYNIQVFAIRNDDNEEYSEFVIYTFVPAKLEIDEDKILKK